MSPPEKRRSRRAAASREGPAEGDAYEEAFRRVRASLPQTEAEMRHGRLLGPLQLAELLALPLAERTARLGREPRYRHAGLVEAACERAQLLLAESPRKALAAAELAATAARGAAAGASRLPDLRARALGLAAEALCRMGWPEVAELPLAAAEVCLAAGSGDPLEAAELRLRAARRARDLGERQEALDRLAEAGAFFRQINDRAGVSRVLLAQARVAALGEPEQRAAAVRLGQRALAGLEVRRDPALAARAWLEVAWHLADAGQPEEALALLQDGRRLPAGWTDRPGRLARLWLEARIACRLGRPAEAAPAFQAAASGWRALGRHRTAARASLDRAEALAAAGDRAGAAEALLALVQSLNRGGLLHQEGILLLLGAHQWIAAGPAVCGELGEPAGRGILAALAAYLQVHWYRPRSQQPFISC